MHSLNVIANPINIMAMKTVVLLLLISLSRHGAASEANSGATPNRDSFLNELSTVASHQGMIDSVFKTNKLLVVHAMVSLFSVLNSSTVACNLVAVYHSR